MSIDIFLHRRRIGELLIDLNGTIGELVEVLLEQFKRELNVRSAASAIVKDPPSNSKVSFMWLGPRFRYLCCFRLTDLHIYRHLKLNSGIERKLPLINASGRQNISDISYSNIDSLHIFTSEVEWNSKLTKFEESHSEALICHHNWISTQDQRFRRDNQGIRRTLYDNIQAFLRSRSASRAHSCIPILTGSSEKSSITSDGYTSQLDIASGSDNSGTLHRRYDSNHSGGIKVHERRDRVSRSGDRKVSYSTYIPINDDSSILESLIFGDHNPMFEEDEENSVEYRPTSAYIDPTSDDHSVAIALDRKLNSGFRDRGHEAIQRMVANGIAKDALTGK
jgi:hypothetical protein